MTAKNKQRRGNGNNVNANNSKGNTANLC